MWWGPRIQELDYLAAAMAAYGSARAAAVHADWEAWPVGQALKLMRLCVIELSEESVRKQKKVKGR